MTDAAAPPDYLLRLARHLAETPLDALPPDALARARWLVADTVGCIAGGAVTHEMAVLREAMAADISGGPVRLIGTEARSGPVTAALFNGTAATVLELAEGHNYGGGQIGGQVVPAALACAEASGASGAELLRGVALGYEAAVRFGRAATLRPALHANGTVGAVGAAVAAAVVDGAGEEGLLRAINLAAPMAVPNTWQVAREGGESRNAAIGHSAAMGVFAAGMAAAGLTGERDAPGTIYGAGVGDGFDGPGTVADWADPWLLPLGYFKRFACGRYIHAALDILEEMIAEGPIDTDLIESVEVTGIEALAKLDNPAPRSPTEARFSTPYAVAAFLLTGEGGPDAFAPEAVADPAVQALTARVSVREDPALTARQPEFRPCRIVIRFADGATREGAAERIRGDAAAPHGEAEMRAKFLGLAGAVWDQGQAEAALDALLAIDAVEDVRDLPLAVRL